ASLKRKNQNGLSQHRRTFVSAISTLGFSRAFQQVPRSVWQIDEVVKFAGATQPQSAINHNALAIHVGCLFAEKVGGKVGEFFMTAEAFHRMIISGALFEIFRRQQTRPCAFGGKGAWGDGVEANVM